MSQTTPRPPLSAAVQSEDKTDYAGIDELWANEKFLSGYNADVVAKLSKYAKDGADVLEFGAGIGTLALQWQARTGVKPECLEIDASLRAVIGERGFVCHETLDSIAKTYDVIYSSNVLEHIEDDVGMLRKLHARLKPGGVILIYVPAFMCLYAEMDAAIGHHRRYEKAELIDKLGRADFQIQDCYYVDSIGFFAWLSIKLRGYRSKMVSGGSLRTYDRYIYPLSRALDAMGLRALFGKNILIVGKKAA